MGVADPIKFPMDSCDGVCETEIIGPGWDIECKQTSRDQRLATYSEAMDAAIWPLYRNGTRRPPNSTYDGPPPKQRTFSVDLYYEDDNWMTSNTSADGYWVRVAKAKMYCRR